MKSLLAILALAFALSACTNNARDTRMAQGALIGGAGGAVVGGLATDTAGGAIIGGAAGAAAGAVIADSTRPRGERECYYDARINRNVCRYR